MMRSAFLTIILVLSALPPLRAQPPWQLTIEAGALYKDGRVDEAVSRLQKAIRLDSTFVDAYIALGQIYLETSRPKPAEAILRQALRYTMSDARVHVALGIACFEQRRFREAIRQFSRALELQPNHPRAAELLSLSHLNLGVEAYGKARKAEALREFQAATKFDPGSVKARRNLAVLLAEKGQFDRAKREVQRGLQVEPRDKDLLKMLVQLCQKQNDFKGALEAAKKLYEYHPDDLESTLQLAYLYRFNNQGDRAIALYRTLLKQYPREKRVVDEFADLYLARGEYDQAVELYEQLRQRVPEDKAVYEDIARIYAAAEKYEEARAAYRKALRGRRDDVAIYHKIAETYMKEGRPEQAASVYQEGLRRFPKEWSLNRALGLTYEELQPEEALPVYQRMMQIQPNDPYPHVRMGVVYSKLDSADCAAAHLRKAVEMQSEDPLAYHELGKLTADRGDTTTAIRYEREAVIRALQQSSRLKNKFLARLQKSGGQIDVSRLDEFGQAAEEIQTAQELLRQSLDKLLQWQKPAFLEADLQEVLQDYPREPTLLEVLGLVYERQGQDEEALSAFRRLVKLDVKNKAGHLGMARILERSGKEKEAILAYKRALTIDNTDADIYDRLIRLYERNGKITRLADEWLVQAKADPENVVLLQNLLVVLKKAGRDQDLKTIEALLEEATSSTQ
jgi:tetratricopeptide (TPR) repeat protein